MTSQEGKKNILVVDDEAQISRVLKTTLSARNMRGVSDQRRTRAAAIVLLVLHGR